MTALGIEAVAPDFDRDYKRKARPRVSRGETPKEIKGKLLSRCPFIGKLMKIEI